MWDDPGARVMSSHVDDADDTEQEYVSPSRPTLPPFRREYVPCGLPYFSVYSYEVTVSREGCRDVYTYVTIH